MVRSEYSPSDSLWKLLAFSLATFVGTAFIGWLMFGIDAVKHSEIDDIMQKRAPWHHDKPFIIDRLKFLENENDKQWDRIRQLQDRMSKHSKEQDGENLP